ncbi:MAG: copper amine oxidase N-terminal domain-containing protein [Defluviitaleaceae bacterium]|nr:copper amine oxidase N-terminal domain-containing protein [Defluviitaleaceae bacterium]
MKKTASIFIFMLFLALPVFASAEVEVSINANLLGADTNSLAGAEILAFADGILLVRGVTNDAGQISFPLPADATELLIMLVTPPGFERFVPSRSDEMPGVLVFSTGDEIVPEYIGDGAFAYDVAEIPTNTANAANARFDFIPVASPAGAVRVATVQTTAMDFINFGGQNPVIVEGRTLVPVRGVFEALGYDVDWDAATSSAILTGFGNEVIISIGSSDFTVNGRIYTLDVPAQIINDRTMLPFRAILEALNFDFEWHSAARIILIYEA